MRLPSLDSLLNKSTATFRRFPLALLMAFIGAGCSIILLHLPSDDETHFYYWNIVRSAYLGMLLFIVLAVYTGRVQLKSTGKVIFMVCGLAIVIIYYFTLPDHFVTISIIRFTLCAIGLHLIISFIPFIGRGELNSFWQYNKIIFLRILTAALYSSVLYIGLSLAMLAIDQLFHAHIDGKLYGDLWIIIAGIFNTWFFLTGFPADYQALETQTDYPKGLKIFTQYVLIPLIIVYLLILYAYMFKIIFTMVWPVGWVSYLLLGFSIAGILSLLLIHPVRNDAGNKWMLVYSRFFYFAIFPLIILLFLAIMRRISDYGITENRYFVLVLALWLVFIAVYFLVSKKKNIRVIPVSLCFVALLTSFGPWGAFRVSKNSQKKHLTRLLEKNNLFREGKILKANSKISFDDHKGISSVVDYLVDVHGYQTLQPYFAQNLDSLMKTDSTYFRYSGRRVEKVLSLMNLSYVDRYAVNEDESNYIDYRVETTNLLRIDGYDYFISGFTANDYVPKEDDCSSYFIGHDSLKVCFNTKKNQLSVSYGDSDLRFNVAALISSVKDKNYTSFNFIKTSDMTLTAANEKYAAKVIFKSIYGTIKQDSLRLTRLQADLMIELKHERENEVGERNQ